MTRFMAGYKAFREPELISNLNALLDGEFGDFESRRLRYAIFWAFYENTAFRDTHKWSPAYKTKYGLYRYIRSIYSPTYRLGEFWKSHLWGGVLDLGNKQSSIPIETENENIIDALSILYRWSNWHINKDICTLHGSILGDVGIAVVDDRLREKVYLQLINPGTIANIEKDSFGNVKSYTIQEKRMNPIDQSREVTYTEEAKRDGDDVIYTTYKDGALYDWSLDERGPIWSEPYGFIPLVMIQHNNVGLDWGWSEFHPSHQRFAELDGLSSAFNDYIRKTVNAPMLLAGVNKPSSTPNVTRTQPTDSTYSDSPIPGRDELPYLYGPVGARPEPMIASLDIPGTLTAIMELLKNLEEDYPELKQSRRAEEGGGEKSGRAYREARREASNKVIERRVNYDDALVRANQMALAIGGFRNYDGFTDFDLESYTAGDLDHKIISRPVFGRDPLDDLELEEKRAMVIQTYTNSGASVEAAAELAGMTPEQIEIIGQVDIRGLER